MDDNSNIENHYKMGKNHEIFLNIFFRNTLFEKYSYLKIFSKILLLEKHL